MDHDIGYKSGDLTGIIRKYVHKESRSIDLSGFMEKLIMYNGEATDSSLTRLPLDAALVVEVLEVLYELKQGNVPAEVRVVNDELLGLVFAESYMAREGHSSVIREAFSDGHVKWSNLLGKYVRERSMPKKRWDEIYDATLRNVGSVALEEMCYQRFRDRGAPIKKMLAPEVTWLCGVRTFKQIYDGLRAEGSRLAGQVASDRRERRFMGDFLTGAEKWAHPRNQYRMPGLNFYERLREHIDKKSGVKKAKKAARKTG